MQKLMKRKIKGKKYIKENMELNNLSTRKKI